MSELSNRQIGGLKAAKTNKERHGKDFYAVIGTAGGTKSRGGGFGAITDASMAGYKSAAIKKWRKAGKPEADFPTNPRKWRKIAQWKV